MHVSIRARHHWRAIRKGGRSILTFTPVSIRARHHWRAIRLMAVCSSGIFRVSIRARHHWRAILGYADSMADAKAFQSAPAITGGRSRLGVPCLRLTTCFNPRPPSLAGDPSCAAVPSSGWQFQSAPAITGGRSWHKRYLDRCLEAFQSAPAITGGRSKVDAVITDPPYGFNPRPPSLAGDPALHRTTKRCHSFVSIRARHHWRAIQIGHWIRPPRRMFQSAPAITGGRSVACGSVCLRYASFNPRPPSLAGDPLRGQHSANKHFFCV